MSNTVTWASEGVEPHEELHGDPLETQQTRDYAAAAPPAEWPTKNDTMSLFGLFLEGPKRIVVLVMAPHGVGDATVLKDISDVGRLVKGVGGGLILVIV